MSRWLIIGLFQELLLPLLFQELGSDWIKLNKLKMGKMKNPDDDTMALISYIYGGDSCFYCQYLGLPKGNIWPHHKKRRKRNMRYNKARRRNRTCLHAALWESFCRVRTNCKRFLKHVRRFLSISPYCLFYFLSGLSLGNIGQKPDRNVKPCIRYKTSQYSICQIKPYVVQKRPSLSSILGSQLCFSTKI